ncbi:MAG: 2-oxoacid:acceptor oxidoreductase family protein [Syntrophales bacterium]|nr:2-oxoacid:acceptor oxidoreductase family protein [Syntrophales bacterium]
MEKGEGYFELTIAGRGGQGALIIGRLLTEAGMSIYRYVTYFPNYGAAMRGGESECTVILSHREITSPAILQPSAVILLGQTTLGEFEKRVKSNGLMMLDSSLVTQRVSRDDLKVGYLPATKTAADLGNSRAANFVFLGAYLEMTKAVPLPLCEEALERKMANKGNTALLSIDKQAMRKGAELVREKNLDRYSFLG